jgi:hypothetical protein
MDFETALKILVLVGAAVVIPVAAYAAIAATRAIWIKGEPLPGGETAEARLAELEARIVELEQGQTRVAELEERLDFAERLLAQPREPAQIGRPQ